MGEEENKIVELGLHEVIEAIKAQEACSFDESIDIIIKLGIDPIKSDQQVRGTINLPGGTGRDVRVAIFTSEENIKLAEAASADKIITLQEISEINNGNLDFDVLIATKEVIKLLKPYGRTIGPLGLMPNLKSGTLVLPVDLADTVSVLKAGRIEVRNDKVGIIHACIGKRKFDNEKLNANLNSVISTLKAMKPEKFKGDLFKW